MVEETVKKTDTLFEDKEFQQEFEILNNYHKEHPEEIEVIWRLARCYFSLSEANANKNEKHELLNKGLDLIKKGLEVNDKHWAVHKWFAILLGTVGEFVGTKEKIGNSYKIKEHALKANELHPGDASTLHMLGKWCYSVSNVGWMERGIASALFATPPSSTTCALIKERFEEALDWFLKSHEAGPSIRNAILIGDTYPRCNFHTVKLILTFFTYGLLKQPEKSKEWYKKAAELPFKGVAEEQFHKDAVAKAPK